MKRFDRVIINFLDINNIGNIINIADGVYTVKLDDGNVYVCGRNDLKPSDHFEIEKILDETKVTREYVDSQIQGINPIGRFSDFINDQFCIPPVTKGDTFYIDVSMVINGKTFSEGNIIMAVATTQDPSVNDFVKMEAAQPSQSSSMTALMDSVDEFNNYLANSRNDELLNSKIQDIETAYAMTYIDITTDYDGDYFFNNARVESLRINLILSETLFVKITSLDTSKKVHYVDIDQLVENGQFAIIRKSSIFGHQNDSPLNIVFYSKEDFIKEYETHTIINNMQTAHSDLYRTQSLDRNERRLSDYGGAAYTNKIPLSRVSLDGVVAPIADFDVESMYPRLNLLRRKKNHTYTIDNVVAGSRQVVFSLENIVEDDTNIEIFINDSKNTDNSFSLIKHDSETLIIIGFKDCVLNLGDVIKVEWKA